MTEDDVERQAQARRILRQISEESEGRGRSVLDRAAGRARHHLGAADVDRGDWAEYWGTRIGRSLGAIFLVGAIAWLIVYLAAGT